MSVRLDAIVRRRALRFRFALSAALAVESTRHVSERNEGLGCPWTEYDTMLKEEC
jgi:hypothetical protein